MKLTRIKLGSFRQFREADIQIGEGVTAIIGPNGAGKTTLLEAISWALYGEQRSVKETLRRLWAEPSEPTFVEIEFELAGSSFGLRRDLRTATLELKGEGGRVAATGLKPVTAEIERRLGLNYEQFKNSFCAEQKSLGFLQFRQSGRQQEEIARMLGFDRLRVAASTARERSRALRDRREGMQRLLDSEATREEEMKLAEENLRQTRSHLARIETNVAQAESKVSSAEPKRELAMEWRELTHAAEAQKKVGARLKQELASLDAEKQKLTSDFDKMQNLQPAAKRYEQLEKERSQLAQAQSRWARFTEARARRDQAEARAAEIEKQIDLLPLSDLAAHETAAMDAKASHENLRTELLTAQSEWQKRRSEAEQTVTRIETERSSLESELAKIQEKLKLGICPTCGQDLKGKTVPRAKELAHAISANQEALERAKAAVSVLDPEPANLLDLRQKEAAMSEELAAAEERREKARIAKSLHDEKLRELELARQMAANLRAKLGDGLVEFDEARFNEVTSELEKLAPDWKAFVSLGDPRGRLEQCIAKEQETRQAFDKERLEHAAATKRLNEIGLTQEAASELINQFDTAVNALNLLRQELAVARARIEAETTNTQRAQERLAELHAAMAEAKEVETQGELYQVVAKSLTELRDCLNSTARPKLSEYASEFLANLTSNRYSRVELDEKYSPVLFDEDQRKQVISGGEDDVVALSLRLALSRMIQEQAGHPLSLLILDEVFGSLDPDRRRNLLEQLDGLRDMFSQILLVSHIEEINEAADHCVTILYDPAKHESAVFETAALSSPL